MASCGGCEARLVGLSNIELLPGFAAELPASRRQESESVARAVAYRGLFDWLLSAERDSAGFRWVFHNATGVERRVRALARSEHAARPFLSFAISTRGAEVVWETHCLAGAESHVDELYAFSRAQPQDPLDPSAASSPATSPATH